LENWSTTSRVAYVIWCAIPLVVLAFRLRAAKGAAGGGRKFPALEMALTLAFNSLLVFVIGAVAIPKMSNGEISPAHAWLIAIPFLPYGLAGVVFLRGKVKDKRTVPGRAIAVYAFSTAGHLVCITLLQGYLLAVAKLHL
jgi:hypothetical protein